MEKTVHFKLNGRAVSLATPPDRMLLWVLRSDLEHTGTKYSCGEGFCGACTVLVDGKAVFSCQYPIRDIEGKELITVEGLQNDGRLHPLQEAFVRHNALQCGFCTPGMIMAAYSLLQRNPQPSSKDIEEAMEGNLCRCGSYNRIVQAIQTAAKNLKGQKQ